MEENIVSEKYILTGLKTLINSTEKPTLQALALEYAMIGFSIFPCNIDKTPIVDPALDLRHGFRDATRDPKLIAKAWHKYPRAGIGLALPENIIVFDCDVLKDTEKKPILMDGRPDIIGLKSLQNLILELNFKDSDLDTLSIKTQSGGRHIYYRMPEGIPSFNHTHALEGLDLKGLGGYVILPNSPGQFGTYEFLNFAGIRDIPESLLKWIQQFRDSTPGEPKIPEAQDVNDSRISDFVNEIMPAWNSAVRKHLGNEFRLAIAGTLFHYGWPEEKADQVMKLIIQKSEIQGLSDKNVIRYTYANGRTGRTLYGFRKLKGIIEEIEGSG
jgi:hypothetical protein